MKIHSAVVMTMAMLILVGQMLLPVPILAESELNNDDAPISIFAPFGHSKQVNSVVFSPDGQLALSAGKDKTLKLWEVSTGRNIRTFRGHSAWVGFAAFSPDGRFAFSASGDRTLRRWEVGSGREICRYISLVDDQWIAVTPEGFFNASPNAAKQMNVSFGNQVYSLNQFHAHLFRPDLVAAKIIGDPDGQVAAAAKQSGLAAILRDGPQ